MYGSKWSEQVLSIKLQIKAATEHMGKKAWSGKEPLYYGSTTHALLSLSAAFLLSASARLHEDMLVKKKEVVNKNGREPSQSDEKENARKESCRRYESTYKYTYTKLIK